MNHLLDVPSLDEPAVIFPPPLLRIASERRDVETQLADRLLNQRETLLSAGCRGARANHAGTLRPVLTHR